MKQLRTVKENGKNKEKENLASRHDHCFGCSGYCSGAGMAGSARTGPARQKEAISLVEEGQYIEADDALMQLAKSYPTYKYPEIDITGFLRLLPSSRDV